MKRRAFIAAVAAVPVVAVAGSFSVGGLEPAISELRVSLAAEPIRWAFRDCLWLDDSVTPPKVMRWDGADWREVAT